MTLKNLNRILKLKLKNLILLNDRRGFTLVELMVVIAIASIMLAAMYGLFISLSRSYTTQEVRADVQQDVRSALNMMIRDIRMAGLDPQLKGIFGITKSDPSEIIFTMDNDKDGVLDSNNFENIAYKWDTIKEELQQSLDGGTYQPVISNVKDLQFTYKYEPGCTLPCSYSDIREVGVKLKVRLLVGADRADKGEFELETSTQCRNLYF
jgi:type IV pilus assembly protein PilW